MSSKSLILAGLVLLVVLSYTKFPGATYLYSDTQIWVPILEHLWDPSVFAEDPLIKGAHVSLTLYDEIALALRRLTGSDFKSILFIQQALFRLCSVLGVYLLARAFSLSPPVAMICATAHILGATIAGPAVLVVEYEPVPRGFAVGLVMLALGLLAHRKVNLAIIAASIGLLYHAPTTVPFWIAYALASLFAQQNQRHYYLERLVIPTAALFILFLFAVNQPGVSERQPLFAQLPDKLVQLQKIRASYNYLSMWPSYYFWHYSILFAAGMLAWTRVRRHIDPFLQRVLALMMIVGILSMPVSHLLTEQLRWSLMPQVQPARAVLYIVALVVILSVIAAYSAANQSRYWESLLWLFAAFAIPAHTRVLELFLPDLSDHRIRTRFLVVLAIAIFTSLFFRIYKTKPAVRYLTPALLLAPFFLFTDVAKIRLYPNLWTPGLQELCQWAKENTSKDTIFLFPDAGKQLYPGIFRACALRAVIVDWKSGGQVNFFVEYSYRWWRRWNDLMLPGRPPFDFQLFRDYGVDYFVVKKENRLPLLKPVYENEELVVYRTPAQTAPPAPQILANGSVVPGFTAPCLESCVAARNLLPLLALESRFERHLVSR